MFRYLTCNICCLTFVSSVVDDKKHIGINYRFPMGSVPPLVDAGASWIKRKKEN